MVNGRGESKYTSRIVCNKFHDETVSAARREITAQRRHKRILKMQEKREHSGSKPGLTSCRRLGTQGNQVMLWCTESTSDEGSTSAGSSTIYLSESQVLDAQRKRNNRVSAEVSRRKTLQQEDHWTCQALYYGMMVDELQAQNQLLREKYLSCCAMYSLQSLPVDLCLNTQPHVGVPVPGVQTDFYLQSGVREESGSSPSVSSLSDTASVTDSSVHSELDDVLENDTALDELLDSTIMTVCELLETESEDWCVSAP